MFTVIQSVRPLWLRWGCDIVLHYKYTLECTLVLFSGSCKPSFGILFCTHMLPVPRKPVGSAANASIQHTSHRQWPATLVIHMENQLPVWIYLPEAKFWLDNSISWDAGWTHLLLVATFLELFVLSGKLHCAHSQGLWTAFDCHIDDKQILQPVLLARRARRPGAALDAAYISSNWTFSLDLKMRRWYHTLLVNGSRECWQQLPWEVAGLSC